MYHFKILPMFKKATQSCSKIIAWIFVICIHLIRPMLGPMNICPYTVGCTQYALQQLEKETLFIALKNICHRLFSCHPFRTTKKFPF